MESLALLVAVMVLVIFSSLFVAVALSFADTKLARGFLYTFVSMSSGLIIWMALAVNSLGTWVMALIIVGLGSLAIWNSNRVKRNNEEIKRLTSE